MTLSLRAELAVIVEKLARLKDHPAKNARQIQRLERRAAAIKMELRKVDA
jgi:hypothetical protein